MTTQSNASSVERKIHFFRADAGVDDGGVPLPFDPLPALSAIAALPFSDGEAGRYETESDGNVLCLLTSSNATTPAVRFCRVRRTALPQMERAGQITDLNIAADTGLLEATHIVFFPNKIVGAEYNHFGPRLSRLGSYLHKKSSEAVPHTIFRPLLRNDAAKQLDRLGEIRLLDLSVHPPFVDVVRLADRSLGDAIEVTARAVDGPETVQVVIKSQPQARQSNRNRLMAPIRSLLNQNDARQGLDRLQVRGRCVDTNRVETIDLLKDHLISTKQIVRLNDRSRALDPDSAFQAIGEAYQQLKGDLEDAAGVSP